MADILLPGFYILDEKKKRLLVFDILFSVFGYHIKHSFSCLIYLLLVIGNQMKLSYLMYDFMVFLYHIKHSCSCLIYYLPLWVLAFHECLSSIAKFINSLRVISNSSF